VVVSIGVRGRGEVLVGSKGWQNYEKRAGSSLILTIHCDQGGSNTTTTITTTTTTTSTTPTCHGEATIEGDGADGGSREDESCGREEHMRDTSHPSLCRIACHHRTHWKGNNMRE